MARSCVWLLFLGAIICVNASYLKFKPKIQKEEVKVEVKQACNLGDFGISYTNCEEVNDDDKISVPHGKRCKVKDDIETGATADYICDNGHWSGTDYTVVISRQKRFMGIVTTLVIGAAVGVACYYLCTGSTSGGGVGGKVYHPPKFPSDCRPRDLLDGYYVEPGKDSIVVDWTAPTATDKNGGTPSVKQTQGINKGGQFPGSVAGTTHYIRYEAKDIEGLTDSCTFHFIVYVRTCDPPVWPANGYRQCDAVDYVIGSQCQYSCHDGYTLDGDNIVSCQTSLHWSDEPQCGRVSCDPPEPLGNGTLSCNDESYSYGTVCARSCNQGFDLQGQLFTQCQADGSWSTFAETTCIDKSPPSISCKSPQAFYADRNSHSTTVAWEVPIASDNTDPNPDVKQTSGPSMNDTLNVGSKYVTYLAIDHDNIASPECTIELQVKDISCGHPKDTLQDLYLHFECSDALYTYGVHCNLSCLANLPLNGTDFITCERNGTTGVWSWGNSYMPYCRDISCPDLDPPVNGAIIHESVEMTPSITMSCNDQYDIPADIEGGDSFNGILFCFDQTGWGPLSYVPDCIAAINPRFLRLGGDILYYSGDCGTNETMEEIRLNYQDIIDSGLNPYLSGICDSTESCTADAVIQCGPIQNRRRRSTKQSLNDKAALSVERKKRSINAEDHSPHDLVKRQAYSHVLVVELDIVMTMTILANESLQSKIVYYDNIMNQLVAAVQAFINNGSLDIANFTKDVTSWQPPAYGEIECDPGYLLDRSTCKPCPAGHYLNEPSASCIKCPIGQYYGGEGSTECVECPIGYTTKQNGSKHIDNCTEICQPGSASPDGMLPCGVCLYGEYQDEYGQASCKLCPSGFTTNYTNTTSSQDCQAYDVLIEETVGPISLTSLSSDLNDVSLSFWAKLFNEQTMSIILQLKTNGYDALIVYLTEYVRIHIPNHVDETVDVLSSTTWTHVGVTLSSSDNSVKVYINGNQVYTSSVTINAPVITNGEFILTTSGSSGLYMTGLHVQNKIVDASEITTYASLCHVIQTEDIIDMGVFQNIDSSGITVLSSSSCDVDDNCDQDPCNGHLCMDGQNRYTCYCSSGWSGDNCTVPPDYCIDNSCENGATCVSLTTNYTCDCLPGYTGSMCEVVPVDGGWSEWTITTPCNKQCGTGIQNRTRSCNSPTPDHYGNYCVGQSEDTVPCNTQACLVCVDFELKAGTMTNCTTDADTGDQLCTVYCKVGKIMEPGYPNTVNYICGPSSLYQWNATELIPSCVEPYAPTKLTISSTVQYNPIVPEGDRPALIASIISNIESTNCSNECEVSVEISDTGVATISYSIELTEGPNLDYSTYISTDQVSPSLYELGYSINQLELTAQQLENFTSDLLDANVNGQIYTAVGSSLLTQGVVHCPDGQVSYDGACIYCPPGTYSDNGYCNFCAKGSYQPDEGQSSCIQCPTGLTTVTIRSAALSTCSETITTTTSPATTSIPGDEPDESDNVIVIVSVVISVVFVIIICLVIFCVWYKKCRTPSKVNDSKENDKKKSDLSQNSEHSKEKITPRTCTSGVLCMSDTDADIENGIGKFKNPSRVNESSRPPTTHYKREHSKVKFTSRPNTPGVLSMSDIDADIENGNDAVSTFTTPSPRNDNLTPVELRDEQKASPPPSYETTCNNPRTQRRVTIRIMQYAIPKYLLLKFNFVHS